MLIEMNVPMNSTGGIGGYVMKDNALAAGMQLVQMIADSKHR
jgi:hypothetical protein